MLVEICYSAKKKIPSLKGYLSCLILKIYLRGKKVETNNSQPAQQCFQEFPSTHIADYAAEVQNLLHE